MRRDRVVKWRPPIAMGTAVRIVSVFALALFAGLAGCQSYTDPSAGRTVGEVTDDASISLRIKGALLADREVSGLRINVEVHQGVVALYGRVKSEAHRLRALGIARDVRGVRKVEDHLVTTGEATKPPR